MQIYHNSTDPLPWIKSGPTIRQQPKRSVGIDAARIISAGQLRKRTVEGYLKSRKGKTVQAANLHQTFQLEATNPEQFL